MHYDFINFIFSIGLNLTEFVDDTLKKTGDQVVSGHYYVTNLTATNGNTNVISTVNGYDFSEEVVPLSANTTITGNKVFTEDVVMANVQSGLVNGLNLTRLNERVAYIDQNSTVTGFLTFAHALNVHNDILVEQLINNINLTEVIATTLYKDGDQSFERPLHFTRASFANLHNAQLLNNVNFSEFAKNVVYKCYGPNKPIRSYWSIGKAEFGGLTLVNNLLVDGLVNDVNISRLDNETVRAVGTYTIKGRKHVHGLLTVQNLTVSRIDGFSFPSDFVRTTGGDDVIDGRKVFTSDVVINGDVELQNKTLNGVNLAELSENIVRLNESTTVLSGVKFIVNVNVYGNIQTGLINGVNISGDEFLLRDGNQTVTASKIFSDIGVLYNGEVVSENNVNGFNLRKMRNESFVSGMENTLNGVVTVVGNVTIRGQ